MKLVEADSSGSSQQVSVRRLGDSESTPERHDQEFMSIVDQAATMLKAQIAGNLECFWELGKLVNKVASDAKYGDGAVDTFRKELEPRLGRNYDMSYLYGARRLFMSVPRKDDIQKLASKNVSIRHLLKLVANNVCDDVKKQILAELLDGSKQGHDIPTLLKAADRQGLGEGADHGPLMPDDDRPEAVDVSTQRCSRFITAVSSHTKKCLDQVSQIRKLRDLMDGQNEDGQKTCLPKLESLQEDLKLLREAIADAENEVSDAIKAV